IAVDTLHSDNVNLAWAVRAGTGDIYTVHVQPSTARGATWSSDLRTLTNDTNASLAVTTNGTLGLLYQQATATAAASRWVTPLQLSIDPFFFSVPVLPWPQTGRSEGLMHTRSASLLAVALSLLCSPAPASAQGARTALVKQSDIIFIGTVTQLGAVATPEIPA